MCRAVRGLEELFELPDKALQLAGAGTFQPWPSQLAGAVFGNDVVEKVGILYCPMGNQPGSENPPAGQSTANDGLIGIVWLWVKARFSWDEYFYHIISRAKDRVGSGR